ncbi:hypothetical protein K2173_006673 [Erythroxylum novogranatense]|uniref:DNA primase large subunit C-terminal domain-containing protein n=1 Tax=Erythroxylum novogranatense TaxID=1862640 RepID=A0AAV8SYT8_9ROSI|nr:hypothetical protein K2173_006673 [Erythroxylum novogranatense]
MDMLRPQSKPPSNDDFTTLPLYRSAPSLEVRLEDFELYAIDRLRVLKAISDGLSRGKKPEEMDKLVFDLWKANMRHPLASEVINKDIISHFVLRLVYCRTEDLRKWFLSMETALFRYRFQRKTAEVQLLREWKFLFRPHFGSVKKSVNKDDLYCDFCKMRRHTGHLPTNYMICKAIVFLFLGMFLHILHILILLSSHLKWTSTIREDEKDRLTPIVEALCTSYLGPDYSQSKEFAEISIKDIDQVAKSSFPLCMRHLFEKLREDHHLKHGGRMQLGLFLKGVGLNLDDALTFWKAEFSHKVGAERFDKEYAYSIRHNYGREGKRTDYTPCSCQKIISSTPGVGDHHGCPYRHFSEENLRAALFRMGVNGSAVEDVMEKVRNRHYQLACTLTFEAIHGSTYDVGVNHPNQYFTDSQKILKAKTAYDKLNQPIDRYLNPVPKFEIWYRIWTGTVRTGRYRPVRNGIQNIANNPLITQETC